MTDQALTVHPQTYRHAVPAPDMESLVRRRRKKVVPIRPARRYTSQPVMHDCEYAGLHGRMTRYDKYKDAVRVRKHGGTVRLLMDNEIQEWHKRIGEIMERRTHGSLDNAKTR